MVIFKSKTVKIELSTKGTSMRKTIYKNGSKAGEYLYERIEDKSEVLRIEEISSKWRTFDADREYGYVIRGQLNVDGKLNGIFKVVKSSKVTIRRNWLNDNITSIDSNIVDWTYYKRRKFQ